MSKNEPLLTFLAGLNQPLVFSVDFFGKNEPEMDRLIAKTDPRNPLVFWQQLQSLFQKHNTGQEAMRHQIIPVGNGKQVYEIAFATRGRHFHALYLINLPQNELIFVESNLF